MQFDVAWGFQPMRWATVDVSKVRVERMRRFGEVYMALALWRCLGSDRFFDEATTEAGREEIPWSTMACRWPTKPLTVTAPVDPRHVLGTSKWEWHF